MCVYVCIVFGRHWVCIIIRVSMQVDEHIFWLKGEPNWLHQHLLFATLPPYEMGLPWSILSR